MKIREPNKKYHYKRREYNKIKEFLNSNENLLIIKGLRRIGKTVLLEQIYDEYKYTKNILFIEFENSDNKENLYNIFVESISKYDIILFDEITLINDIIYDSMYLKDYINNNVKIIITGSQSLAMNSLLKNSLLGRCKSIKFISTSIYRL